MLLVEFQKSPISFLEKFATISKNYGIWPVTFGANSEILEGMSDCEGVTANCTFSYLIFQNGTLTCRPAYDYPCIPSISNYSIK